MSCGTGKMMPCLSAELSRRGAGTVVSGVNIAQGCRTLCAEMCESPCETEILKTSACADYDMSKVAQVSTW